MQVWRKEKAIKYYLSNFNIIYYNININILPLLILIYYHSNKESHSIVQVNKKANEQIENKEKHKNGINYKHYN